MAAQGLNMELITRQRNRLFCLTFLVTSNLGYFIPPPLALPPPHLPAHNDLHCLVVGGVDGGHTLDLDGGVAWVHVMPGDGVHKAQGAGLQLLPLHGDVCHWIGKGLVLRNLK